MKYCSLSKSKSNVCFSSRLKMPIEGTKRGRCLDSFSLRLPHSNATKHHRARAKQEKAQKGKRGKPGTDKGGDK